MEPYTVLGFLDDAYSKLTLAQDNIRDARQILGDESLVQPFSMHSMFQNYLEAEDIWFEFFAKCLDYATNHIEDFING